MNLINSKHIKRYIFNPSEIILNFLMWKNPKISTEKFLFIIGAPRSGTTLLQRLIITNPKINGFENETSILSPKSIKDYSRFENLVSQKDYKKKINNSKCIVSFFEEMHNQFINESNLYILEKTPQHIKKIKFILKYFPKSKLIHIFRDGRDCYVSGKNAKNIPQSKYLVSYARYWKKCIDSRMKVKSNRIHDISYESLVLNPKNNLIQIFKFLNIDFYDNQIELKNYSSDKRANTLAFKRLNKKIDSSSVSQYLDYMTVKEIKIFNAICGKQLKQLGYKL